MECMHKYPKGNLKIYEFTVTFLQHLLSSASLHLPGKAWKVKIVLSLPSPKGPVTHKWVLLLGATQTPTEQDGVQNSRAETLFIDHRAVEAELLPYSIFSLKGSGSKQTEIKQVFFIFWSAFTWRKCGTCKDSNKCMLCLQLNEIHNGLQCLFKLVSQEWGNMHDGNHIEMQSTTTLTQTKPHCKSSACTDEPRGASWACTSEYPPLSIWNKRPLLSHAQGKPWLCKWFCAVSYLLQIHSTLCDCYFWWRVWF